MRGVLAAGNLNAGLVAAVVHHLVGHALHILQDVVILLAHETLNRKYGTRGVHDGLALGGITHNALAAILEGDYRRRRVPSLTVGDYNRLGAFQNRYTRVSRS